MLCFFISTLFSRANIAAAAGGVIFFCFYLPYSFLVVWEESLSSDFKIISVSRRCTSKMRAIVALNIIEVGFFQFSKTM